jgi:hypothetical protein
MSAESAARRVLRSSSVHGDGGPRPLTPSRQFGDISLTAPNRVDGQRYRIDETSRGGLGADRNVVVVRAPVCACGAGGGGRRLVVVQEKDGAFLSGWRMSPQQLSHVTQERKLGGG